jgi:hypothetical protein
MEIVYSQLHSETFVPAGCSSRPVSAFAIVNPAAPYVGHSVLAGFLCDAHLRNILARRCSPTLPNVDLFPVSVPTHLPILSYRPYSS